MRQRHSQETSRTSSHEASPPDSGDVRAEQGLLFSAYQELQVSLEELQVAEEEMRQQNEQLSLAQESITTERHRYQELFEFAPNAYLVTDLHGTIREANQAAAMMLGVSTQYLTGKPLTAYVASTDLRAFRARLLQAPSQSVGEWEFQLHHRHGQDFPTALTVGVARDRSGQPVGLRWLVRDITERVRAEEQIRRLNADLEERVRARTLALEEALAGERQAQELLQVALRRERHIAETLQRSLLPEVSEDQFPGLSVATFYEAALAEAKVGGDFYDVFSLDASKVALVVGDVSGKGLEAAARTAEIKYVLRTYLRADERPATALAHLNDFLYDARCRGEWEDDLFVVVALAVIDPATGETEISVAGAEPILLLGRDGTSEAVEVRGLLLGIAEGTEYAQAVQRIAPGEVILMATDGITEARHGHELLGTEGLQALAHEARGQDTVHKLGATILCGARAFAGGALQDDACILLARRK